MKCNKCQREDKPPYRKGACNNCYQRARNKAHYIPGVNRAWCLAHPERVMWLAAKHNARRHKVPFTISVEDIVIPEKCPILEIHLQSRGKSRDSAPSLDRVIPELGYVAGNIAVISNRANRIKSDATLDELKKLIVYMSSFTS